MNEPAETFDIRQLAERTGVDVETIRLYTKLGFLEPKDSTYTDGDVARVRLVGSCERGGLPLEGMAEAVERGVLSFSFLDLPQYRRFGTFSDRTYGQAAAEAGVSFELVRRVDEALGLSIPESEEDRIPRDRPSARPHDRRHRRVRCAGGGCRAHRSRLRRRPATDHRGRESALPRPPRATAARVRDAAR